MTTRETIAGMVLAEIAPQFVHQCSNGYEVIKSEAIDAATIIVDLTDALLAKLKETESTDHPNNEGGH